jgi:cell wall assembly regulator SMI1
MKKDMDINNVIEELLLFSDRDLTLNAPAGPGVVERFESRFAVVLPNDYKQLVSRYNGFSATGTEVYGVGKEIKGSSIDEWYVIEHDEVANPMYKYLVPFSPDGYGNHYCFDLSTMKDGLCQVIFWRHDCSYSETDPPEVANESFAAWIKEVVIDWNLENNDYDGKSK